MSCADALGVMIASGSQVSIAWVPLTSAILVTPKSMLISLLLWLGLDDLSPVQESHFAAPACVERTLVASSTSVTEPGR